MDGGTQAAARLDGKEIARLAEELGNLLKLRTLPIGMKLFESIEDMEQVPGVRRPARGKTFSTCQLVTQARIAGFTLGITTDNVTGIFVMLVGDRAGCTGRDLHLWPQDGGCVVREPGGRGRAPGRHVARAARPLPCAGGFAVAVGAARSAGCLPVLRQSGADDFVHQRAAVEKLPALRFQHHR